ncbi:MAG: ZIP family metal transporter [Patescibacteria group bacterium]
MTLFLIAIAAFSTTLIGGMLALRLKDRLHLILGFSAGAIIAVAFFDLLPEALELVGGVYDATTVFTLTALGFAGYLVIDRLFLHHAHHEEGHAGHVHRGAAGAGSLSFHSFLDGVGIGLAFQVSPEVGAVVTAAVLTHDFSDGINTVSLIVKNGGSEREAFRWLLADATAPVLGIISTLFFTIPETSLGLLLALFAGFFIYIGASDLIPESHHAHPVRWTTVMTLAGMVVLYVAIQLAGL